MPASRTAVEQLGHETGIGVEVAVEDDEQPGPAAVDAVVFRRRVAQLGHLDQLGEQAAGALDGRGQVRAGERRGGRSGLGQPLQPVGEATGRGRPPRRRSGPRGCAGTPPGPRSRRRRRRPRSASPWTPSTPDLGEVDGDRHAGESCRGRRTRLGSSSRSSSSPLLVDLGDDPARRVAEAEADASGSPAASRPAGPQVDRAQLGPPGQVGEVGSGPDPLDALLGERLGDLGLAVARSFGGTSRPPARGVWRPDRRSSNQLPTIAIGDRSVISRNCGDFVIGEHHDAAAEGGEHHEHLEPPSLGCGRGRTERVELALLDPLGTVRGAVELDLAEPVDGAVGGPDELAEREAGRPDRDDVVAVDASSARDTLVAVDQPGRSRPMGSTVTVTVQSAATSTWRWERDTVGSLTMMSQLSPRPRRYEPRSSGALWPESGPSRTSTLTARIGVGGGGVGTRGRVEHQLVARHQPGLTDRAVVGSRSSPVRTSSRRGAAPGPTSPRWSAMSAASRAAGLVRVDVDPDVGVVHGRAAGPGRTVPR